MFIGDGAKLVRDAFLLAKEKAPAIIFIDELDAIGTKVGFIYCFIIRPNYFVSVHSLQSSKGQCLDFYEKRTLRKIFSEI